MTTGRKLRSAWLLVGGTCGAAEAGKEVFLLRAQQPFAKGFGFGVAQGGAAQGAQLAAQGTPLLFGALGAPRPRESWRWAWQASRTKP